MGKHWGNGNHKIALLPVMRPRRGKQLLPGLISITKQEYNHVYNNLEHTLYLKFM